MGLKGEIVEKRGCCSVEWKIRVEDFSSVPLRIDESWTSPSFYLSDASWYLQLSPNDPGEPVEWISICLWREEWETETRKISYVLSVQASDGKEIASRKFTTSSFDSVTGYGWAKFCNVEELLCEKDKFFPGGKVTFFCQAHVIGGRTGAETEPQTDNDVYFLRLPQNFKDLFLSEAGSDVTIKVKDKEFRAHSKILSARSSVFAAMLRHNMKEKNTGVVEISEYESDTFREFLIFLYSAQAEKLTSENVVDLYSAADKYDVEDLKTCCSKFMMEYVTVDSFCSYLTLSIIHGDKNLKFYLTAYFSINVKKITVTNEWMSFAKQYPVESKEIFMRIAPLLRNYY